MRVPSEPETLLHFASDQRRTVPKRVSLLHDRFAQKNCMMSSVFGTTGNPVPLSARGFFFSSRVRLVESAALINKNLDVSLVR